MKVYLVTGGAGFIGGNFVLGLMARPDVKVMNLDALTYAGNLDTLASVMDNPNHVFVEGNIGDRKLVSGLLKEHRESPNPPRLIPIPASEYPTPAKRPKNTALSLEKLKNAFGITPPDWNSALKICLDSQEEN